MAAFTYRPLSYPDSIRLFRIEEAQDNDPITCQIFETQLSEALPYTALSYAWEESITTNVLQDHANGNEDWSSICISYSDSGPSSIAKSTLGRMNVGLNLQAALRRLRKLSMTYLWIDYISINQSCDQEKGQQVAMMDDIYKNAHHVLVWLGEETEVDHLAIGFIKEFCSLERILDPGKLTDDERNFVRRHGLSSEDEQDYSVAWRATRNLLDRAWFSRLWCVQEICLGGLNRNFEPLMMCGSHLFEWGYLAKLNRFVYREAFLSLVKVELSFLGNILKILRTRKSVLDLQSARQRDVIEGNELAVKNLQMVILLSLFSTFKASVPVDKIYALLGVANDVRDQRGTLIFRPDYHRPVLETNLDLTSFLIQRDLSLETLHFLAAYEPGAEPQLASWVVDWTNEANLNRCFNRLLPGLHSNHFRADSSVSIAEPAKVDGRQLFAHAYLIGEVTEILPGIPSPDESQLFYETVIHNWSRLTKLKQQADLEIGDEEIERYLRTLSADLRLICDHWREHFQVTTRPSLSSSAIDLTANPDLVDHSDRKHRLFNEWIVVVHLFRRLFMTTSCMFGLGPRKTRPGDRIYILQGARVPFVLHPTTHVGVPQNRPSQFEIIGEAYVDGVMYGELFRGDPESHRSKWEPIVII